MSAESGDPKDAAKKPRSVFANAKSTKAAQPTYAQSFTMTCVHCGAQQETALDFLCRYCKKQMTAP